MNKVSNMMIRITATTLLLTIAATALADDTYGESGRKGPRHQRGMQAMPVVEQLTHALKRLDLGDNQKEDIRGIMREMKTDVRPLMQETRAGHQQLKELIKAEHYDQDAITVLAKKEGDLAAERMMIASRALAEIFSHLTDEQRDELDAMAAQRQERRSERRKHRSNQS